jgi:hypothetical protein
MPLTSNATLGKPEFASWHTGCVGCPNWTYPGHLQVLACCKTAQQQQPVIELACIICKSGVAEKGRTRPNML